MMRWTMFAVGVGGAFAVGVAVASEDSSESPVNERGMYRAGHLTSPFLESSGRENGDPTLVRARAAALAYIAKARANDASLSVSMYVRDLDNGHWIGIDSHEQYLPASLTKVAILVYTLQRSEVEPGLLDHEVVFPGLEAMTGDDSMGDAPDSLRMVEGEAYTVRDLLRRMIAYSDNHASQLLMAGQPDEGIATLLYNVSAEQSFVDDNYYFDAHTVGALFRTLYSGSLLGRRNSEFALALLTQSFFRDGLRRYLPREMTVASKFGFHASMRPSGPHHELHECGVVYRPAAPYVICVMTRTDRGTPENLDAILGELSRIVWTHQTD